MKSAPDGPPPLLRKKNTGRGICPLEVSAAVPGKPQARRVTPDRNHEFNRISISTPQFDESRPIFKRRYIGLIREHHAQTLAVTLDECNV
jgi:hypothetical protein